jgi:hypothetical protein
MRPRAPVPVSIDSMTSPPSLVTVHVEHMIARPHVVLIATRTRATPPSDKRREGHHRRGIRRRAARGRRRRRHQGPSETEENEAAEDHHLEEAGFFLGGDTPIEFLLEAIKDEGD